MTGIILQDTYFSIALKSLITISTLILIFLVGCYHAREIQVRSNYA